MDVIFPELRPILFTVIWSYHYRYLRSTFLYFRAAILLSCFYNWNVLQEGRWKTEKNNNTCAITFVWDSLLTFCITKEKKMQSVNKSPNHVVLLYECCCFFRFPSPFPEHIPIIETAKQDGGSETLKCR